MNLNKGNDEPSSIVELIAADKLEDAVAALKGKGLTKSRELTNRIVMQSARLARNTQSIESGRITQEQADVERNRVAEALLGLIRDLELSSATETRTERVSNADLLVATRQLNPTPLDEASTVPKFEVIHGVNNLKSISWIELGALAGRSVCRVLVSSSLGPTFGTGFLINGERVMTNNHVISSVDEARHTKIEFNYQLSANKSSEPTVRYDLDPDAFFHTNPRDELDYTIVAVKRDANKPPLDKWGTLMLNADADPIPHELIGVIQHPNAQVKQIAISGSVVVEAVPPFLHYTSDTMAGSSGSPVFNDLWQVIAIHHRGGPTIGGVPTNEGILMSSIKANMGDTWPG